MATLLSTLPANKAKEGRGREQGGGKGEPQDMKIKQEAAANRICLLAKKCNAFQFQFRPLNSFAYLRAAKQEQCALRPCPQLPPPLPPGPSLGTKFTQCKYAEPHARTHESTRTHSHTHSRRTNAHRHLHWQLSFPFYLSLPLSHCCILYNDAFFPLLLQLQNSYQRHFPFGQAWASCGLGVAGRRAGTACTQKLFKNSLQVLHKMMEKREEDKINPAHTQRPTHTWAKAPKDMKFCAECRVCVEGRERVGGACLYVCMWDCVVIYCHCCA